MTMCTANLRGRPVEAEEASCDSAACSSSAAETISSNCAKTATRSASTRALINVATAKRTDPAALTNPLDAFSRSPRLRYASRYMTMLRSVSSAIWSVPDPPAARAARGAAACSRNGSTSRGRRGLEGVTTGMSIRLHSPTILCSSRPSAELSSTRLRKADRCGSVIPPRFVVRKVLSCRFVRLSRKAVVVQHEGPIG